MQVIAITYNNFRNHLLNVIDQNHPCNIQTKTKCKELQLVGKILSKLMVIYATHEIWNIRNKYLKKMNKDEKAKEINILKKMDAHNKNEGKKLGERLRANIETDCNKIVEQHNETFNRLMEEVSEHYNNDSDDNNDYGGGAIIRKKHNSYGRFMVQKILKEVISDIRKKQTKRKKAQTHTHTRTHAHTHTRAKNKQNAQQQAEAESEERLHDISQIPLSTTNFNTL